MSQTPTHVSVPTLFHLGAPDDIRRLFVDLGGRYTIGAPRLCGNPRDSIFYMSGDAAESGMTPVAPFVRYSNGIEFPVKGPPGANWRVVVAIEPEGVFTGGRYSLYIVDATHVLCAAFGVSASDIRLRVVSEYERLIKSACGL